MKERPIIFSGPMVKALLSGTKTQTRRVVKASLGNAGILSPREMVEARGTWLYDGQTFKCPYGAAGERLWCREELEQTPGGLTFYRADCAMVEVAGMPLPWRWKGDYLNPIFMPRWASRITLEITAVRVQRLNEIIHEDAIAEGCPGHDWVASSPYLASPHTDSGTLPDEEFRMRWESLHGPGSWAANPFVWCLTFQRVEGEHASTNI